LKDFNILILIDFERSDQNTEKEVKMAAALASIAEPGCRKMSRSNTCIKLPFGHKIHPAPDRVCEFALRPKTIEHYFMRQQLYVTSWRSQFSG
jgi:hypothetical protein